MARLDDAELTAAPPAPGSPGAAASWQAGGFAAHAWGDETVVHDDTTGAIHLIPTETARVLQRFAAGLPVPDAGDHLDELQRIGLIRRDTPAA